MPSENRVRLNDDECLFPVLPGSGQENPEEAIELPEFWSPTSSVQNGELLAEREVFECQFRAEPQGGWNQREQPQNHQDHAWEVLGPEAQKVNRINAAGVLAKECVQQRLACSVGGESHRGRSQEPRSLGCIRGGNETDGANRQSHPWDGERVTGP